MGLMFLYNINKLLTKMKYMKLRNSWIINKKLTIIIIYIIIILNNNIYFLDIN